MKPVFVDLTTEKGENVSVNISTILFLRENKDNTTDIIFQGGSVLVIDDTLDRVNASITRVMENLS